MVRSPASGTELITAPTPWHSLGPQQCLDALAASPDGLSDAESLERLRRGGPNRLALTPGPSRWRILLDQFANVMLLLLLAVAAVSGGMALLERSFPKDAIAVLLIVALTAFLGFLQESRAQTALQSLLRMAQPTALVLRDGRWQRVDSASLVPGDLIRVEAGDRVPADARLLAASALGLQEAALTGEAETVSKQAEPVLPVETPVADRRNCLFLGTDVVRGRGLAVVTGTGMATALGTIADLIQTAGREPTPLQKRLEALSRLLVGWALVVLAVVVLVGWALGNSPLSLLALGLSTAVAIVPEGLPAVITVSLAIGTQRMVRRAALIRHLPAVEALGSITVICTDKTGTLTQNRQEVEELRCGTLAFRRAGSVRSDGGASRGGSVAGGGDTARDAALGGPATGTSAAAGTGFLPAPDRSQPPPRAREGCPPELLRMLLEAGVLGSDAEIGDPAIPGNHPSGSGIAPHRVRPGAGLELQHRRDQEAGPATARAVPPEVIGDPTEAALVRAAAAAGIDVRGLGDRFPRLADIPFSSERQWMAVWVRDGAGDWWRSPPMSGDARRTGTALIAKGAPERILCRCDRWMDGAGVRELDAEQRQWWLEQARAMASGGLRVLAFAAAPGLPSQGEGDREAAVNGLILLGLMGQMDPARPEVPEAVARCHRAGIRPVMITGDHPLTGRSISESIGLAGAAATVLQGQELESLTDEDLRRMVRRVSVFTRVTPEQKLRIVRALQANGEVVAMTGDGVNDAPALKQAHIGVAMGLSGSDVSRDAADMVLLDDNFATIVNAVEEGRLVYANIRRFVRYILGCNLGELITIGSAPFLGLALTPLQILWINLVTDGLPALALAMEPGEEDLMRQAPIQPGESIFARGVGRAILRSGVVFGALVVGLMVLAERLQRPWQSMAFTTLCLAQLGNALSARSERPLLQVPPFSNPWLLVAVLSTAALQLLLLYAPPLAGFFGIEPLPAADLALCGAVSLTFLTVLEGDKLIRRGWRRGGDQEP